MLGRQSVVLLVGLALVVGLSTYDVAQAVSVRCQRAADRNSVVMLDELDVLPGDARFELVATQAERRAWRAGSFVSMKRASPLIVRGTAAQAWHAYGRPAVFAEVDGRARVHAERGASSDFRVVIPSELLPPGPHRVTFSFVKSDLSGYFVLPMDLRVNVLH